MQFFLLDLVKQKVGVASDETVEDYFDEDEDDLDIEPLDLDDEPVVTPVNVVEDIIADDSDVQ